MDRGLLFVLPAFMLAILMAGLDQTAVATSLPSIATAMGGLTQLPWVVTAYGIAIGVSTPIHGKLADSYDRKRLFQAGLVVFLAGSALCGASQSMAQLIVCRALQGIGAGGIVVYSQAILAQLIPPAERGRYVGFTQSAFVVSTVAGPVIGGVITQALSWRYIFYVNVPICVLALVVVSLRLSLPMISRPRLSLDWPGAVTFIGAVSGVFMLIELTERSTGWTSPPVLALAAGAVVMVVLCAWIERRARDPLLPLGLMKNAVFRVVTGTVFTVGFATAAATVFLPLYLQVVLGYSPARAGLMLAPLWLMSGMTATVCGQIMARIGRYRPFPIAGTLLLAAGLAGLAVLGRAHASYSSALVGILLVGAGLGLINSVMMIAAQNAVGAHEIGRATSATAFSQTMGAAFGAATLGAVFAVSFPESPSTSAASPPHPGALEATWQTLAGLPDALRSQAIEGFAGALALVFAVGAGLALVGFLLSLTLRELPLGRHPKTPETQPPADRPGDSRS
ncbi:MFS transporter [Amycolatopsis sp. NBC_01488]|uniref:MFS transporter n=1 Tax=Amycolatopsis sp. NBC_01488 TaxID=2903563 RepID=UPI002E29EC7F|nr:MFS transporter [Amycolatopsis sp. NBC_01488]